VVNSNIKRAGVNSQGESTPIEKGPGSSPRGVNSHIKRAGLFVTPGYLLGS